MIAIATPAADIKGLIEYMKDETARLEKQSENINSCDHENTYKSGYSAGHCAGARELARTVSLFLGCGDME